MRFILFIIVLLMALMQSGISETLCSVHGEVLDLSTRARVSSATIQIPSISICVEATETGEFSISDIPPGVYELTVSHVGYRESVHTLTLTSGSPQHLRVLLDPKAVSVDGITVTATRFREDEFALPTAVSITSREVFTERSSSTTSELLREEPGILVQKTTAGHGAPIVRGLIGKHVLLLYDGIRLNKPTFRFGANQYLNTVNHETLDKIEVVRGPSSVMYGSDAIGGVVNLVPRTLEMGSGTSSFVPEMRTSYSTADDGKDLYAGFVASLGSFRSSVGATYKYRGDLRAGGRVGRQSPTGWDEFGLGSRTACIIDKNKSLVFDLIATRQNRVPRYDKYICGDFEQYTYDPQDRDLLALTYNAGMPNSVIHSIKCNISYQRETEGRTKQKTNSSIITQDRDRVITRGGYLQMSSLLVSRHWLSFGCEFYDDKINSERIQIQNGDSISDRPAFPDNSGYRSVGLFARDEYSLSTVLRMILGLRYSRYRVESPLGEPFGDLEETYSDLTGSLALTCRIVPELNLVGRWSQGFRAPNLNDVAVLKYSSSGVDAPSSGLKPEISNNFEIGVKMRRDNLSGSLFCFYNRLSDLIDRVPGTYDGKDFFDENGNGVRDPSEYDIYQRRNVGESDIYGFEMDNVVTLSDAWEMRANCFWTHGENRTDDEPLSRIPPLMGMLAVRVKPGTTYWIEAFCRAAGSQRRLSARDIDDTRIDNNGTPSWVTLNLRSKITVGNLSFNVALENIADATYKEHGSGVCSPGRNLTLTVSYGGM
ncbi:MAG: TonB-dependent receptor [candidate division Zixibacteria bacterium]|nr:TonB-dependent receptor [candidate division Zixibacteria bacterium]